MVNFNQHTLTPLLMFLQAEGGRGGVTDSTVTMQKRVGTIPHLLQ